MQSKLIENAWICYREMVSPRDAGAVQLQESRRAFYAGAWAFLTEIMRLLEPGAEPTAKDLELMAALDRELREFQRAVKNGQA